MIQVNLLPDIKSELLKARSLRTKIISICILTSLVAGGAVILLSVYVFGAQTVAEVLADNSTKDEFNKLSKVEDLPKLLTIQEQLSQISSLDHQKPNTSRIFDMLSTIIPSGQNKVAISTLRLDTKTNTVTLEGAAKNGYEALEVFKKTIDQTKFQYTDASKTVKELQLVASPIVDGDRSYGQDSEGGRVLRFKLTFTYPSELLSPDSTNGRFIGPERQKATDSAVGVPKSLFTDKQESDNE